MDSFVIVLFMTYCFKPKDRRSWSLFVYGTGVTQREAMYVKSSKCEFWLPLMSFLGHILSKEIFMVDP